MARQRIQLLLSDVRANQAMDEWVVKARSHQFDLLFADIVERLRNGDTKGIGDDIKSLGALGDSSQTALVQLVAKAHQELLDDRDLADGLRQHVRDGSAKINDDLRRRIAGAGSSLSLLFDQRIRASDSGEDSLWNLQQVLNRMAADGGRLDQKGNEILAHVTPEGTLISWIAREWVRETELLARRCDTFEALVRPRDSMTPESFSSTRKAQVEAALQFCLVTRASVSEERLKALGKAWERLVDALSLAIAPLEGSGVQTGFGRDIQVLLTVRKASPATGWNTNRTGA